MRCPDCNKFVSFEEAEPEMENEEVTNNNDGTAVVECEYRIVNQCAECSSELKEATITIVIDDVDIRTKVEGEKEKAEKADSEEGDSFELHNDHELSIEVSADRVQDSYPKPKQVKDRKTGEMKMKYPNPRYTRTLYGVGISAVIHCEDCNEDVAEVEGAEFVEASSMEELV